MDTLPECRYCGANALPREHECKMRVVFIPSKNRTQDIFTHKNVTLYSGRTLEQMQAEYPDAVVLPWEEAHERERAQFVTQISETTRERFWEMLEILPPCKWTRYEGEESFFVSEAIHSDIHSWFARIGERYFTLDDSCTLTHREIMLAARAYMLANPAAQPGTLQ